MTTITDSNAVAEEIRDGLADTIDALDEAGVKPGLVTVLINDDPANGTYVSMKQCDYKEVGVEAFDYELDPETPTDELYSLVDNLNDDDEVHDILVQMSVPDHVDDRTVLRRIDLAKDIGDFHPKSVGRLVADDARFKSYASHGVQKSLVATDVETEGADVVAVGRSDIVSKPMANLFIQKAESGNATVTVCHSRTDDLAVKTREADIIVAAAGIPELVTGDMLSKGVVVIGVGVSHIDAGSEKSYELAGGIEFDSVKEKASAITPVPDGVGLTTRAMLLRNTVKVAAEAEGVDVDLP